MNCLATLFQHLLVMVSTWRILFDVNVPGCRRSVTFKTIAQAVTATLLDYVANFSLACHKINDINKRLQPGLSGLSSIRRGIRAQHSVLCGGGFRYRQPPNTFSFTLPASSSAGESRLQSGGGSAQAT